MPNLVSLKVSAFFGQIGLHKIGNAMLQDVLKLGGKVQLDFNPLGYGTKGGKGFRHCR